MSTPTTIVFIEHVLWEPGEEWRAALEHLAARFARIAPLDVDEISALDALHLQLGALEAWSEVAGVELDRELSRWLDEHLSMHVRPNPTVTRAVRALAAQGPVHAASALPARAGEAIARHAGCWRSFEQLHASVRDADALASLVRALDATDVRAASPTPIPADITPEALLDADRSRAT